MSRHYLSGDLPLPEARSDGVDRPFFEAAREHRLVLQQCETCGNIQFPPEVLCIRCQGGQVSWSEVNPRGILTTFTRVWHSVHPALTESVPYLVGVVEVAPGARLIGNILGDPNRTDLSFDMPMEAVFEDHDEQAVTLIQWMPA